MWWLWVNNNGAYQLQDQSAREMWTWCIQNNILLSPAHIDFPGHENVQADALSGLQCINTKWKLKPSIFQLLTPFQGTPDIFLPG